MKTDRIYLEHIKEAIERIKLYTQTSYEQFCDDIKTQDAVIRNFEIIGEATKQITDQTKNIRPNVPWRQIAGLRDVLIHDYMGVDVKEIWNIAQNHLSNLENSINEILAQN